MRPDWPTQIGDGRRGIPAGVPAARVAGHARRRTLGPVSMKEPRDGFAKAAILAISAVLCAAQGYPVLAVISALAASALVGWVAWARREN